MSVIRIASRYAKSLIDLAIEQDKLERIMEDVKVFSNKLQGTGSFIYCSKARSSMLLKNNRYFNALFGGQFDETTNAFIRIILNKGREGYLPEIADEFVNQYKEIKHISTVKLTTAAPLGADDDFPYQTKTGWKHRYG